MLLSRALLALGAVGGAVAAATGQERCNQIMCIKGLRDNGVDTFTLRPMNNIAKEHFGWAGLGFGMQMIGSPMVIMWPNEDGTFTLSQRQAVAHHMPGVVAEPPRTATLNTANTYSNSSMTGFSFSVPSNDANMTAVIWAMSRVNPGSANPNAGLIQHTWRGLEILFMDAEYTGEAVHQDSPYPVHSKTVKDNGNASFALIAHIICGCFAAMLVLPGGVVVPRITRGLTTSRWWFTFHAINQGLTAIALVTAAFGIGISFGQPVDSKHRKLGVALFALIILQTILGMFSHWYKPGFRMRRFTFETKRGRGPSNFLHVAFGIVCVGVGWSASWTGLTNEWELRGHPTPAKAWRYGWGIIVMIWLIAYIVGIIFFLPRQLRIESHQRELERQAENRQVYRGSAVALANEYYMEQRRAQGRPDSDYLTESNYHGDTTYKADYGANQVYYGSRDRDKRASAVPSTLTGMTGLSRITSVSSDIPGPLPPPRSPPPGLTRPSFGYSTSGLSAYGSASTTTFQSDYPRSAAEKSPPGRYTSTFTPNPGPPPPPSPLQAGGLDGETFQAKTDSRATYELPPIILDSGVHKSKTPSPKLPWAGQINPLAKRNGK